MSSQFITYFCYEEFFRRISQEKDLIVQVSRYNGHTVFGFLLNVNTELQIWDNGVPINSPKYLSRVYHLLPNILGQELVYELKNPLPDPFPKRSFFHTRQLLYLAKLTLRHCSFESGLIFGRVGIEAGLIFLKINDQLHLKDRTAAQSNDEEASDYALLGEFIAVNEFTGADPGAIALRAYRMLLEFPSMASDKPFFLDLNAVFMAQTGLVLEHYFAMCFSLIAGTLPQFYGKQSSALTFGRKTWDKSTLPPDTINAFWKQVSISIENAKSLAQSDHGSNDVTIFRKYPLLEYKGVRFGFDVTFFMEKLWAGPFWTIFYSSESAKNKLPQFTGWIFERYVNELLKEVCKGPNVFIAEPQKSITEGGGELTDGIILCGDILILIEYKSVMFTAESKYSGDRHLLRTEIRKKLVLNQQGKPKGVTQLSNAIDYLNSRDLKSAVKDVDLSSVRAVYPLLITLEPLGDGLMISRILNREFQQLRSSAQPPKFEVKRLHCTGIATMERHSGAFAKSSVADLLNEWDEADPYLKGSWKMFFDPSKHETEKHFNKPKFEEMEAKLLPLLQLHE